MRLEGMRKIDERVAKAKEKDRLEREEWERKNREQRERIMREAGLL